MLIKLKFTKARQNKIADICEGIAQILLGTVVIPFILDKFDPFLIVSGLFGVFVFYLLSLYAAR